MGTSKPTHILLLTSTNLASNPRCLKEVRALVASNVQVTVIAFNLHNWTNEKEIQINNELPGVVFHYLETTRRDLFPWLFSSLLEQVAGRVLFRFARNTFWAAMTVSKRSWLLYRWIKRYEGRADLVIAHNAPAFYAAHWFAKKKNIPFALDIEDYHPGEGNKKIVQDASAHLMKVFLPGTFYASFASPLIKAATEQLLSNKRPFNFITINNVFPSGEFLPPVAAALMDNKIELVWFSQFIDYGRGLEKLLPVTDKFGGTIHLTLIGNLRSQFYENELKKRDYIRCQPSLSQQALNQSLCKYDIGLALEDKYADLNRDICLTNKICAYHQSGLYIVASDTSAQKLFMEQHQQHGLCISLEDEDLVNVLLRIMKEKEQIRKHRQDRYEAAVDFSWEHESQLLVKEWNKLLNN